MRKLLTRIMEQIQGGGQRFKGTLTSLQMKAQSRVRSSGSSGNSLPSQLFQTSLRPKIHRLFKTALLSLVVVGTSSLLGLWFQDSPWSKKLLPSGGGGAGFSSPRMANYTPLNYSKELRLIRDKDLFLTDRSQSAADYSSALLCEESRTKSSLPIKLFDTVVMQNPLKSLAALQIQNKNELDKLRVRDKIGSMARLDQIRRLEVVIKNLQNGKCELVVNNSLQTASSTKLALMNPQKAQAFVQSQLEQAIQNNGNDFKITRSLLQEKLADSSVLTQAKAIPITNPDGTMAFQITEIVPGSIYAYLGIQNGDMITKINGQSITSFNEIMGLVNQLATMSSMKLTVNRDGTDIARNYEISNQ